MIGPKTQLVLQKYTEVSDGMGGYTVVYQAHRKIKGVLTPLMGDERMITGKVEVFADYKFFVDFPLGIEIVEKDRFIYGSRKFDIVLVSDPAMVHRHLEIMLEEIT